MDDDLKGLALLTLRTAFWEAYSDLVACYIRAAEGLDDPADVKIMLSEMTSPYAIKEVAESDFSLNLHTRQKSGHTLGWDTLAEALGHADAVDVFMCGKRIFHRTEQGWRLVEGADL